MPTFLNDRQRVELTLLAGDGPFREAYEAMAESIASNQGCMAVLDDVERSSGKLARRLLQELRAQGYYPAPAGEVAA